MPAIDGRRTIERTGRQTNARAKPMAGAITAWFNAYARHLAREVIADATEMFFKTMDEEYEALMMERLAAILRRYGLSAAGDAANNAAGEMLISPQQVIDAARGKQSYIQWFYDVSEGATKRAYDIGLSARYEVQGVVQDLVVGAMSEIPTPSSGELARRIRNTLYQAKDGRVYTFSSERAALIARTEIGQVQALGEAQGYFATADPEDDLMWLSLPGGGRGHEKMNGKTIKIWAAAGSNTAYWFELPSGVRMPYPKFYGAPIKETIQCRCGKRVVSKKLSASKSIRRPKS